MRKLLYIVFIILVPFCATQASDIIRLDDSEESYTLLGSDIDIFEDTSRTYTLAQVSAPSFSLFKVNREKYAFNRNPEAAYWIRFSVKNNCRFDKNFMMETYSPHTNLIQFFVPDPKGGYRMKEAGENFTFDQREHINKNIVFDLPVSDSTKVLTYYVRIVSKNYSGFDFRIKSVNYFMYYSTNEYYFLGLYYGILLIMAVYNLLIYISVRENVYLFYVFYVVTGILNTMTDDGLGFQYIWAEYPQWIRFIGIYLAPSLLMITFVMYTIVFLELNMNFPKLRNLLLAATGVYFFYYLLVILIAPDFIHFKIVYIIPFLLCYAVAIYTFRKGYKPARFFIVAYTFVLISIIIIQLRAMQMIPGNLFTVYSLNYGLVFEIVILSFALADRIRIIKRANEEAQKEIIERLEENKALQEKVNRELEHKVAERTQELKSKNGELEEANSKLKVLNEKVNEMNAKLDYDNWHLKKDLKEDLKARIIDSEVPYEQFNNVFPDEATCFRYLEELKWGKGYKCRKCGNPKYTKGSKLFTRKCTKCGNVESVTAYTLFHGVRFPINKAFYMTYIVHRRGNKITLDELSELLDLRRNTCWSFKKKVMENIDSYKKKSKDGHLDTWEEIIL
ncbi:MAG TPA: 7TM diverse intracellular signaling domain-containing protein [Cytophagaceae bacterium]|nr:7TM diverse intracellular signaling domain-containing protein [Cytophagaceae bacterium]